MTAGGYFSTVYEQALMWIFNGWAFWQHCFGSIELKPVFECIAIGLSTFSDSSCLRPKEDLPKRTDMLGPLRTGSKEER
jgi:hypothetical protein